MRLLRAAFLLAAVAPCAACLVGTLQPIYEDDSIVFDEALVGHWENRESEVTVAVTRGEWRSYDIAYTDRFGTTRLTGHLTSIGPAWLLNVRPEDGVERPILLLAVNAFLQIDVAAEGVRVREADYASVLERLEAGRLGIAASTDLRKNVLLTAPSSKVRAWLKSLVEQEELWAEWKTFTRVAR